MSLSCRLFLSVLRFLINQLKTLVDLTFVNGRGLIDIPTMADSPEQSATDIVQHFLRLILQKSALTKLNSANVFCNLIQKKA
jgi:hypothetical protein